MAEIAIVDDEKVLVNSLRIGLTKKGYRVYPFYDANGFLSYLGANEPDLILLDLRLPDMNGLEVLRQIRLMNRQIPTVMITAHGDVQSAVQAMKTGAFDYLNKPFDMEELELIIKKVLGEAQLVKEVEHHRQRSYKAVILENIIGDSPPMLELYKTVKKLSHVKTTTVLIRGESGTGKDLLAKAIHNLNPRSGRPFIEINCASLPEHLLESELFGHEKGAFTDAKNRKTGLVEIANNGTLFLDEIGELSILLQAKLLKFIETKTFRRVGGTSEVSVNVFIITATNRNLEQAIREQTFRQDLFYRLNVVPLFSPPLRDRKEDILKITDYYLDHYCRKFGKDLLSMALDAQHIFLNYDWPGNVRELKNLIERLVILSDGATITGRHLPDGMIQPIAASERENRFDPMHVFKQDFSRGEQIPMDEILTAVEKKMIVNALEKADNVKTRAAKALGISRYSLLRRISRLKI
ncbi:Response regulator [Desulforapulum autotrophicum HRM2]|uniref:Response regulator n=1 Tax=Desulforapulum autotrophicum (strain ATCC 43914 / DSM 3382 / VKM B-1955 / HRM2) TaxID=177437 RepID=C0QG59_DESAH|nr:sigma-54 dependent transcriptional regulator [Desulforapulum autotrophicum]ACN17638.1 Response regulator [Desulforapulum autotrophicum HRM2]